MNRFIPHLLFISFAVCICTITKAQPFSGKIKGGIALTQLDGDAFGGYHKIAPYFGLHSYTTVGNNWTMGAGIEYIEKGSLSDNETAGVYYQSKLQYIQLPVWVGRKIWGVWHAHIGISAGYLKKAQEDKDGYGAEPAEPPFDVWEFCALAGISYKLTEHWELEGQFQYSIFPIRNHPGDQTFYLNRGQFNNVVTLSVVYNLAIGQ